MQLAPVKKPPLAARLMHDALELIGVATLGVAAWALYHLIHLHP